MDIQQVIIVFLLITVAYLMFKTEKQSAQIWRLRKDFSKQIDVLYDVFNRIDFNFRCVKHDIKELEEKESNKDLLNQ